MSRMSSPPRLHRSPLPHLGIGGLRHMPSSPSAPAHPSLNAICPPSHPPREGIRASAKVVETWGAPNASCAIVTASLADRATDPVSIPFRASLPTEALPDLLIIKGVTLIAALLQVLAVARKNGVVELLNPLNGDTLAAVNTVGPAPNDGGAEGDPLTALHLFTRQASDLLGLTIFVFFMINVPFERALLLDFACSLMFGVAAKSINVLFSYVKPAIKDNDSLIQKRAYKVLSMLLKS
ncbi:hypothetical protein Zm00014a_020914 [Zea mays]|uniref:Uncharacterized protein n=1 Tax=Zea mays TaxID=4577 RepID=A0A3L6DUX4_MAIZE|nr:hypothetical protein Zm00014a_020914 [Zea mays]